MQFKAGCCPVLIGQRVWVVHMIGRMGAMLSGAGEENVALQPIESLG